MAAERANAVGQAEELDEVILAYVEAVEAGQSPDRAAWLARYPHLAGELAAFFADQDQFTCLVAPIAVNTPRPSRGRSPGAVALDVSPPLVAGCLIGEYELLDEIASGGMGVIYKARHQTLGRVVALKMIRSGALAMPEDLARFRLEAEAAANLDHANIVPIYDVGEHDGQPYFTMKYIEGGSLAQSPPIAMGGRAELIMKVARAVHYAHERGILHRDLKPANILLDRRGQPHVTDFGLATRLPSSADAGTLSPARPLTQMGIAVGTPGYMAPEQASGPKKGVTVAADVYSLGAVLYELLTGRPPFKADTPLETLVEVLERQPVRPRSLAPAVPRDLETICLKCLEKDPARRYASAEALANDLSRFLEGEPITARPASPAERFWRWCRRSPVVAGLAAALVLIVAGGLPLVTVLWQQAEFHRRLAETQRNAAEAQVLIAKEERARAEENARQAAMERQRAEAHRREAEESFQQAHEIVDRMCMRLSEDRLSAFPGLQPLRKEILEIGLKYYQGFVAKRGDDPALKADLAKAHFHVAFLTNLVGSRSDALSSYAQARTTYEELLAADPANPGYRQMLAKTCINAGAVMEATNDRPGALASYEHARDLLEALEHESPDAPKVLASLGIVYNNLGNVNRGLGRLDDSRDAYDRALAVQERQIRANPDDPGPHRELAVVYVNVAILHGTRGNQDEAMRWHEKARDLQEKLHHDHPLDREVQHDLALSYRRIGDRLVRDGKLDEGVKSLQKGHELIEPLATANKSVTERQSELALSHRSLGHARRALAKQADADKDRDAAKKYRDEAVKSYQAAIDALGHARRQDRATVMYTRDLAATLFDLALLQSDDLHRPEDALRAYASAADLYRELARAGTDADALADLAATTGNMGHLNRELHRYDDALTAFNDCRETREQLVRLRPDDPRWRNDLATAWFNVARIQSFRKRRDDETTSYERSREIREQLVRDYPQNVTFRNDLGTTLVNLGNTYAQTGHTEEALATLRRAVEQKRLAFTAVPKSADYRHGLNIAYGALAEVERVLGTPSASAAALMERRELWPDQPDELYRIACEQAMTAAAVGRNKATRSADEQVERALYLDQAMETLRRAVASGFSDGDRLGRESALAPLRSREEFQKLLAGLKK
jgi:serine/threonine-protein kinase